MDDSWHQDRYGSRARLADGRMLDRLRTECQDHTLGLARGRALRPRPGDDLRGSDRRSHSVNITTVWATHDNTVPRELLGEAARKALDLDNVSETLGPPVGYVIRFTNG